VGNMQRAARRNPMGGLSAKGMARGEGMGRDARMDAGCPLHGLQGHEAHGGEE